MNSYEKDQCHAIIHTATVAAGASSLIPIPIADAVPITAAQITMVIGLGKVFDMNLSKSAASGIISGLVAMEAGKTAARAVLKWVPIAGQIANVGIAAGFTETLGWATAYAFDSLTPEQRKKGIDATDLLNLIKDFFVKVK